MSVDLATTIDELSSASEPWDYDKVGFHQCHSVELSVLVDVAKAFLHARYVLEMLTCQDLRVETGKMLLCYSFNRLESVDRQLLHVAIDPDTEEAPTLSFIYGGANWFEREVYDMYGVRFREHPDLERILLPEDADFFALRKDFGRIDEVSETAGGDDD